MNGTVTNPVEVAAGVELNTVTVVAGEGVTVSVNVTGNEEPIVIDENSQGNLELVMSPVVNHTQDKAYETIQAAIDGANNYDKIVVKPGTYAEKLTIDRSIELIGPNADVLGTGDRAEEAVITFPAGLEGAFQRLILIEADNVTISGFTLDDNYDLPTVGNNDGTNGIAAYGNEITIKNNIVDGFSRIQIHISSWDGDNLYVNYRTGALVEGNLAKNAPDYSAIYLQGTSGDVKYNTVVNAAYRGIQIQPYGHTIGGSVTNNEVDAIKTPIWYNTSSAPGETFEKWVFQSNNVEVEVSP